MVFVDKNKIDPISVLGHGLKNWSDEFAAKCSLRHFMVFKTRHRFLEGHIIHNNYDRFEVYIKK